MLMLKTKSSYNAIYKNRNGVELGFFRCVVIFKHIAFAIMKVFMS